MHGSSADCLISEPTVLKLRFFKFFGENFELRSA